VTAVLRYFWSLGIGLLALLGGVLYLYETFHLDRLENELVEASFPTLNFAWTPEDQRQLEREEANRLARHVALVNEVHRSAMFLHIGLLACLIGVVAAILRSLGSCA
jgi:hypothetical protein